MPNTRREPPARPALLSLSHAPTSPREEEDSDIVRVRDLVVRETHLWQLLKGV
jgi:hypothetical protein